MSKKIGVVAGTRPEVIKLVPLVMELRDREHEVLSTCSSQHGSLVKDAAHSLGFNFDHYLKIFDSSLSLEESFSSVLQSSANWYESEDIGLVIVQGDTLTAYAAAMAAFFRKIPLAHVEAGLRTYDLSSPFPEEGFRQMISRIASFHFCPTAEDCANLVSDNIYTDDIYVVGNTVIDGLLMAEESAVWPESYSDPGDEFVVLVTCHRRESWGDSLDNLIDIIPEIPAKVYVVCHPNPVIRSKFASIKKEVEVGNSVPYLEMLALLKRANLIITDSGGITEEAAFLGKPIIIYREATERVGAITGGCGIMSMDKDFILEKIEDAKSGEWSCAPYLGYGTGDASGKIVDALEDRFLIEDTEE